jgi:hypothetical protein
MAEGKTADEPGYGGSTKSRDLVGISLDEVLGPVVERMTVNQHARNMLASLMDVSTPKSHLL